jgi:hypothetical protein
MTFEEAKHIVKWIERGIGSLRKFRADYIASGAKFSRKQKNELLLHLGKVPKREKHLKRFLESTGGDKFSDLSLEAQKQVLINRNKHLAAIETAVASKTKPKNWFVIENESIMIQTHYNNACYL